MPRTEGCREWAVGFKMAVTVTAKKSSATSTPSRLPGSPPPASVHLKWGIEKIIRIYDELPSVGSRPQYMWIEHPNDLPYPFLNLYWCAFYFKFGSLELQFRKLIETPWYARSSLLHMKMEVTSML